MSDQLYLSYRLHSPTPQIIVRGYEKLLKAFPYSRLTKRASTLHVTAVTVGEPPLFEDSYPAPLVIDNVLEAIREFAAADVSFAFEAWWDLWQFDKDDWQVAPARVTLTAFAPEFEAGLEDDLRIEFGIDALFLPQPERPNYVFMAQSNIRSLLHLVHQLDAMFPSADRMLWTESGENFAVRLQEALSTPESALQ
ncbi:MAG: hypothetical protein H7039_14015 [Bryobacteraceae bacterium]|nr:hypothetical protein [Bryobacteraceae bacterium]